MWRRGCCSLLQLALVGLVAQTSVARELQVLVKPDNQISNGPPDLPLKSSYLELDDPQLVRRLSASTLASSRFSRNFTDHRNPAQKQHWCL